MLLLAHIFKRRSRGDREEVKLKLFNLDGSDYEGSGPGGGSSEEKAFYIGWSAADVADGDTIRIPFRSSNPSYVEGFDVPEFNEFDDLPVAKGAYLVRVEPSWNFSSVPAQGYTQANLQLVDSEGNDMGSYGYVMHQYIEPPQDTPPAMQLIYVPDDGMHFEIEVAQGGTEQTVELLVRVEVLKI